jgi:hypothetical protein
VTLGKREVNTIKESGVAAVSAQEWRARCKMPRALYESRWEHVRLAMNVPTLCKGEEGHPVAIVFCMLLVIVLARLC